MNDGTTSPAVNRLQRRAQQYLETGQLAAAQTALESILKQTPHDGAARSALGHVQHRRGQPQAATRTLLQALEDTSRKPGVMVAASLAQHLFEVGESKAARDCLDKYVPHDASIPLSGAQKMALARTYQRFGKVTRALELAEQAVAQGIDDWNDRYWYGLLLQFAGRIGDAEAVFNDCLQRWPTFSSAALARARLRRQNESSNHVDDLRVRMSKAVAGSVGYAEFEFALFKELDDLGRYTEAWAALERGNAIMAHLAPYDARADTELTDAIIRCAPQRTVGKHRFDGPTPIFIVGLPRSGTTLLDRMLSAHSRIASAGELSDFLKQLRWMTNCSGEDQRSKLKTIELGLALDHHALGQRYLDQTQWRAGGHDFYIDKLPGNFQLVHLIRLALPQAPILHIRRTPIATCFSHYKAMFGMRSTHSYDLQSVANYHRQYARLAAHWHAAWPGALHDVDYEQLVREPEATLRSLLAHCGLAFEPACIHPADNRATVDTLSSAQVREPIHTRGLDDWQHYASHLAPLEKALSA